jgi:hypothetical protein
MVHLNTKNTKLGMFRKASEYKMSGYISCIIFGFGTLCPPKIWQPCSQTGKKLEKNLLSLHVTFVNPTKQVMKATRCIESSVGLFTLSPSLSGQTISSWVRSTLNYFLHRESAFTPQSTPRIVKLFNLFHTAEKRSVYTKSDFRVAPCRATPCDQSM